MDNPALHRCNFAGSGLHPDPHSTVDPGPFEHALSLICGKWRLNILFWIWRRG